MKGNHNHLNKLSANILVVINMSKIQNERKSQLPKHTMLGKLVVINMSKIQNERKSQLIGGLTWYILGCN